MARRADPLDIGRHWRRMEDLAHFSYGRETSFQVDHNGDVHAPTGPGIGADIDWDLINSSVTAVISLAASALERQGNGAAA